MEWKDLQTRNQKSLPVADANGVGDWHQAMDLPLDKVP